MNQDTRDASWSSAPTLVSGGSRGAVQHAGVLLHGRGGAPENMTGLVARLELSGWRWLAPAAPGGAWYPQRFMAPLQANEPHLTQAVGRCDAAIEDASEQGRLEPGQIAIVGFSQGACLATEYALRYPGRCGALVIFTGGLIGPPGTRWQPKGEGSLAGLRVLLTGSDVDEWVPVGRVEETAEVLASLGADVTLRVYSGRPHIVADDELAEARVFLKSIPAAPARRD